MDGMVVSDANAIRECILHGIAEDDRDAARQAVCAGLDMDMGTEIYLNHLKDLAEEETAVMSAVDEAVRRILSVKMWLGLFENPYVSEEEMKLVSAVSPKHRDLCLKAAEEPIVLLKNDTGILPLAHHTKISLVGTLADSEENSQETERLWVNVEADDRTLREIYLPAFRAAIKEGGAECIMGAYNLFRGKHCCENKELNDLILRKEWGFDGVYVSDWGAVHNTKEAAETSLDVEMSVTTDFNQYCLADPLLKEVREGRISEECIDRKAGHILKLMFRLKMIDAMWFESEGGRYASVISCKDRKKGSCNTEDHRTAIRKTSEESIVLLKNEGGLLPLCSEKMKRILVIGDNAERLHSDGGGSAEIKALYEISPLMGIKNRLGGNCLVEFARGYDSGRKSSIANWQQTSLESVNWDKAQEERDSVAQLQKMQYRLQLRKEAVLKTRDADAVIVIKAGSPVSMDRWSGRAKAILWDWYRGMEDGRVLSEIIFGDVNPSGKLPMSMPFRASLCPALILGDYPGRPLDEEEKQRMNAHLTETYREGIFVGYRYYEKFRIPVQFCFGHGLSYTEFTYSGLRIRLPEERSRGIFIYADIKNTGSVTGKETVQIYAGLKDAPDDFPVKELKAFRKVQLRPGESYTVAAELLPSAFSSWHTDESEFTVDEGKYCIYVGSSLDDIRLSAEVTVSREFFSCQHC